jgi:superfamily II DNA or RNA helicase
MDLERKRSMFSKFLSKISAKKILGFTATAYRNYYKTKWEYGSLYHETAFGMLTDQRAVNGFAYIISYKELMDEGYLKKIVYYQWDKTFDNNRLKLNSQGTNYDEKAVEEYTAREDRVATIMQAVLFTMTKRNKIIIYASCKKQALMLLEELKRHGVDCPFLSDSTSDSDREEIIRNFKESKKAIMMNLLILKQGFDDPSLDALIFCRPMRSIPYYIQIAGRLSRPDPNNPDKKPIFVDCTSTARNLGKIENYFILKDKADKYQLYDCVDLNKKQLTNMDCSKWKIK